LVFDIGDAVAQDQLALFQPLHLDDVGARRRGERRDRRIEIAMLLLQTRKLRPKLAFFLSGHRRFAPGPDRPIPRTLYPQARSARVPVGGRRKPRNYHYIHAAIKLQAKWPITAS
jgi:hypothetical protein